MRKGKMFMLAALAYICVILPWVAIDAGYDYNRSPKPAEDISDLLIPMTAAEKEKYGDTERELLMKNLITLLRGHNRLELRVSKLEAPPIPVVPKEETTKEVKPVEK